MPILDAIMVCVKGALVGLGFAFLLLAMMVFGVIAMAGSVYLLAVAILSVFGG